MMADTFRVTLTGDGVLPSSVVVKVAAADEASRRAARTYRSYELEVGFYRDLAPRVTARVPRCHWAGWDAATGDYALVLEDLGAGRGGDQLRGCDADQAAATVRELARLHADFWNGAEQYPWLQRYRADDPATFAEFARGVLPGFLDRFSDRLSGEVVGVFERFGQLAHRYDRKGQAGPQTVTHGDLRADNLIFEGAEGGTGAAILDWQNLFRGNGLVDLGYFLGTSMRTVDRREHERDLVRGYCEGLRARGIVIDGDECWSGYRRHSFAGICVVLRSFDAIRTDPERERRLLVMAERSGQQVLDLSAEPLLEM
jgi:aminoglycoside/choline kinase family phosphotransferase